MMELFPIESCNQNPLNECQGTIVSSSSVIRLSIDVGNSRIKFGLFRESGQSRAPTEIPPCLNSAVISHGDPIPWGEIQSWIDDNNKIEVKGVVAGGHPNGIARICDEWPDELGQPPMVVRDTRSFPLSVNVDEPDKVGIDRLLNTVAVNVFRPVNVPAIVVDSGTATTVDFISADGVFQGGAILPGFDLLARALHEYTALLPMVPMDELATGACEVVGKNTRAAIRSGQVWGQLGSVRELIRQMAATSGVNQDDVLVTLTGGGAELLLPHLQRARGEPFLALQGLVLVAAHLEQEPHA